VAANLRPASLDLGLVPALEWLAEDLARRSGIACRVSTDGADPVLAEGVSTAVFRMVQECLTNVMRHARASSVHVDLQSLPGRLRLCVRDDGVGFDAQAPRAPGRFGLLGMRERALQAGGTLQIDSTPGHGTRITIDLPTD
jgi:signal transduction histidine kinase